MISVGIFVGGERIELFDDEKISVTSSIQNINDISKVFTDYSQTFTVPASTRNNRIFKHWYENSLDSQFSTLVKVDAYIELDTILFRRGKIQLESCNIVDGQPQNYSITFIGSLGSLKDKFAGLFLKNFDSDYYDITYTPTIVKDKVTTTAVSDDVMFPLISSDRYWTYGSGSHDVNINSHPIRYNELFPAIRLSAIFDMIQRDSKWDINFNGSFLTDARFTNAYLWLKNAETFTPKSAPQLVDWNDYITQGGWAIDLANNSFRYDGSVPNWLYFDCKFNISLTVSGITFKVHTYSNGVEVNVQELISTGASQTIQISGDFSVSNSFTIRISAYVPITFNTTMDLDIYEPDGSGGYNVFETDVWYTTTQTVSNATISPKNYFPDIKIEDFFAGILKMFNLTCFSEDGVNFTVEQLESYYNSGEVRDITKYIKSDNIDLNRVKSYKKINFEYEKSESLVNVGFFSNNGVEYGSLLYSTNNEGDEYSIKLPFEDLNFSNLQDKLQVGYALKNDLAKYIPKPIILYDYNPTALTALTGTTYHFATALTGNGTGYTSYKAFGQEYSDFSLNFNSQQSTLTNTIITKSLYNQYYENYFANIFSFKSRIYKVSAVFPISLLTSLKLNDRLIIRDKKFIINTMQTDLTSGEVQLELLTDFRQ